MITRSIWPQTHLRRMRPPVPQLVIDGLRIGECAFASVRTDLHFKQGLSLEANLFINVCWDAKRKYSWTVIRKWGNWTLCRNGREAFCDWPCMVWVLVAVLMLFFKQSHQLAFKRGSAWVWSHLARVFNCTFMCIGHKQVGLLFNQFH